MDDWTREIRQKPLCVTVEDHSREIKNLQQEELRIHKKLLYYHGILNQNIGEQLEHRDEIVRLEILDAT